MSLCVCSRLFVPILSSAGGLSRPWELWLAVSWDGNFLVLLLVGFVVDQSCFHFVLASVFFLLDEHPPRFVCAFVLILMFSLQKGVFLHFGVESLPQKCQLAYSKMAP